MTMRYVFKVDDAKRYAFPTHINDIVLDRAEASTSEVLHVVILPGHATPSHLHNDMEQVYHVLEGKGVLEVGTPAAEFTMTPGDVVRIPPCTLHQIKCSGEVPLRYLAVDCFLRGRPAAEPTWRSHVEAICRDQGWKMEEVLAGRFAPQGAGTR